MTVAHSSAPKLAPSRTSASTSAANSSAQPAQRSTRLVRRGRGVPVDVDPALYDVLNESMEISRRSGGSFDVTVGPLVRVWQTAQTGGQAPSANALAKARRCAG